MKPEDAYLTCFLENFEELTFIHKQKEYKELELSLNKVQKEIKNELQKNMSKEEALFLLEKMSDLFYAYMETREKEVFKYAYKEGLKIGTEIKKQSH